MQAAYLAALALAILPFIPAQVGAQVGSQDSAEPPRISRPKVTHITTMALTRNEEEQRETAQQRVIREEGMFGLVLMDADAPRRAQFCGWIADNLSMSAPSASDSTIRASRVGDAWRLQQRLASLVAAANHGLVEEQLGQITHENGQMMGLLSYAPDPWLAGQIEGASLEEFGYLFFASIARRCDAMLDAMGVAQAEGTPPAEILAPAWTYRWRGRTGAELFGDTQLIPWAAMICIERETPLAATNFADAPLDQRGVDGISLLDWAMECGDREGFAALVEAGFDLDAPGQFDTPPVIVAVDFPDTYFLVRLLAEGADPNATGGSFHTALGAASWKTDQSVAFDLLRNAGASLDFPDFALSMWGRWSLHSDWQPILDNWAEFRSDPVRLGWAVTFEFSKEPIYSNREGLDELKRRLESEHGVCFPVATLLRDLRVDERGFWVQPECPAVPSQ